MEYRHYYLAKELLKRGFEVVLISGSYSHLFSSLPKVEDKFTYETIDGIEYIWIKVPRYGSSKSLGRIWNMFLFSWRLRSLKIPESSHVIVSSPSLFPIKIAKKWAEKFQSKLFFEVRDIWPLTLVEFSNISPLNPIIKLMEYYEKFAYRNADKIISLLPNAQEYFVSRGMQAEKFVYLPNGIEIEKYEARPLPLEIKAQIPSDKFIIAYAGTIGVANNLDYLIEAAVVLEEHKDIHFIILGQGGEKHRLQNRVKQLNLQNVTFIEVIQRELVGAFLKNIDVAFISLLPENLFRFGVSPNKVFEYMYAKKPIIWAINSGNNLVKEAKCGISVPSDDVEALAKSILEMKSLSQKELEKLGENGYYYVKNNHSYKTLAEQLVDIIEE
jgi:glycosyltransferase involved in cell wall biosynthesis